MNWECTNINKYYKDNFNNKIKIDGIGEIKLDKRSIKDSIYHGVNTDKVNAFKAAPHVIKNGKPLDVSKPQNNGELRYLFVAPITLKGENYYCEVVVKSNKDRQGVYIHEVELKEKLADVFSTTYHSTLASSKSIIANLVNDFNPTTYKQEIQPSEEKLIAGYTYNEVMDKLTEIYSQLNDRNLDEKVQKALLAKAHVLEDAFEVSENNMLFGSDKQHEIMLNAYYIMNNQEIPDEYIELDSKSKRSYKDLKELHDKKKGKAESEYYGYFAETNDKSFISIMSNHNASTALHELGHKFLSTMQQFAKIDKTAEKHLEEINKWLGSDGFEYTVQQQEKFALGFEAYLRAGKAPTYRLKKAFEHFKSWLHSIYNRIFKYIKC